MIRVAGGIGLVAVLSSACAGGQVADRPPAVGPNHAPSAREVVPPRSSIPRLVQERVTAMLLAAEERPLHGEEDLDTGSVVMTARLLMLPSFGDVRVIRVSESSTSTLVRTVVLKENRGFLGPGSARERVMTGPQAAVARRLKAFRELPVYAPSTTKVCFDGTGWLIETRDERGYHHAYRHDPGECDSDDEGAFRALRDEILSVGSRVVD